MLQFILEGKPTLSAHPATEIATHIAQISTKHIETSNVDQEKWAWIGAPQATHTTPHEIT